MGNVRMDNAVKMDNAVVVLLVLGFYSWGLYGLAVCYITFIWILVRDAWNRKDDWVSRSISFLITGVIVALNAMPVELQIYWNNIEGVDGMSSAGQLIAFTVGAFSLTRANMASVYGSRSCRWDREIVNPD
jgi:hypothetical protein